VNEKDFLMNYLQPSTNRLDKTFPFPLPDIEGLKKSGDFIVQGELEETFSVNIISKFESDVLGVRLIEVYKNSQNKDSGLFIRLVGSLSLVKNGYPFLFLDAAVTNVSPLTTEPEDITTRVAIHLPQADPEQKKLFFTMLSEKAQENGVSYRDMKSDALPDFWGSVWLGETKKFDLDMIRQLRNDAWLSYKQLFEQTKKRVPFDYRPVQERMMFDNAAGEHLLFKKMGLSVPMEAQAAFFSVMVAGV